MKKLLLFLLLTLSSCNCSNRTYFIVLDFQSESENLCSYRLHHGGEFDEGVYIRMIDTCGKYNVGDTLKFKK